MKATAVAHPNIALVKYWGKRDIALNLPAVGSISLTLGPIRSRTEVAFDPGLAADELLLNGQPHTPTLRKASLCLDRIRDAAGIKTFARVESNNDFPTAAGLASSASGFAALVKAANEAAASGLDEDQLSAIARLGSGSAARSLRGGFVEWSLGTKADGSDSIGHELATEAHWPLAVVVGITSTQAKKIGSTAGMELSRLTSPYYAEWVSGQPQDLAIAREAIQNRDFEALAEVSEQSCLKMHALAMAARPGILYWNAATMAGLNQIRVLRESGTPVFFTVDAGPHIKTVCLPEAVTEVSTALAEIAGVENVLHCRIGGSARVVSD